MPSPLLLSLTTFSLFSNTPKTFTFNGVEYHLGSVTQAQTSKDTNSCNRKFGNYAFIIDRGGKKACRIYETQPHLNKRLKLLKLKVDEDFKLAQNTKSASSALKRRAISRSTIEKKILAENMDELVAALRCPKDMSIVGSKINLDAPMALCSTEMTVSQLCKKGSFFRIKTRKCITAVCPKGFTYLFKKNRCVKCSKGIIDLNFWENNGLIDQSSFCGSEVSCVACRTSKPKLDEKGCLHNGVYGNCTHLGIILLDNDNGESHKSTKGLFEKGCNQNEAYGCLQLAFVKLRESNDLEAVKSALKLFKLGCNRLSRGCSQLDLASISKSFRYSPFCDKLDDRPCIVDKYLKLVSAE